MSEDAFLDLPAHRLRYRIDGAADDARAPWLVFSNSLGTDIGMWAPQAAALAGPFRVLRMDARGHGGSTAAPPPYSLADLGGDVLALMDALGIARAHFCGLSIGGLTGQWLGVHAGDRFDRIVVCATAAKIGTAESWEARIAAVRDGGLAQLTGATAERWFTPGFQDAQEALVAGILDTFAAVDPAGYTGCCAALAGADLRADIARIANPLLAISGDDDPVCTPADLQFIADGVKAGRHVSLPGRHIVNLESAQAFNAELLGFLAC
ncbi:MAG: 3-oxoadipate enol-lactonase [Rhizobiales bacterium 24-66-13]|jgi:3-oxoadipate enol-lactonase|nr:MAG: 3-oxoadipate enol-lactonase [Rhizobiales bacterium 35-66-30]OYZ81918.1 MAG: 3-oxoadipate enol-lactonase [Rhizobiales bacterium 24-66-13]OZB10777.1 MAG: 3-oxoadipate enol-lactonase [Rhizobiales bacterium 39-66-18]HQS09797.1 3-oxoadipate enol-lactonase [Xanthobacteraceae bacterium]HQS47001.1 3-oxoadipate enol-lactonase [Xanthobacteraceae bacterium]